MSAPRWLKPWTLARVEVKDPHCEQNRRSYIGELVSFPTPEGSIMVRTVPGLAATITEVAVADVSRIHGSIARAWVHYALVSGSGSFPTDMLRYDCAVPVNFTLDVDGNAALDADWDHLIVATTSETRSGGGFTPARWASFGWKCSPHPVLKTTRYERGN